VSTGLRRAGAVLLAVPVAVLAPAPMDGTATVGALAALALRGPAAYAGCAALGLLRGLTSVVPPPLAVTGLVACALFVREARRRALLEGPATRALLAFVYVLGVGCADALSAGADAPRALARAAGALLLRALIAALVVPPVAAILVRRRRR